LSKGITSVVATVAVGASISLKQDASGTWVGELDSTTLKDGELDRKIGSMTRLLVDPDIDATAKRAVSRQVGELEAQRERLQDAVAQLANEANDNTARLAGAVRQALAEAQESLAAVATPAEMRDFIEQYVGPMVLKPDGEIERRDAENDTTPAEAEVVKRSIVCTQRCSAGTNPKRDHRPAQIEKVARRVTVVAPSHRHRPPHRRSP